jgi:hypothetical protein
VRRSGRRVVSRAIGRRHRELILDFTLCLRVFGGGHEARPFVFAHRNGMRHRRSCRADVPNAQMTRAAALSGYSASQTSFSKAPAQLQFFEETISEPIPFHRPQWSWSAVFDMTQKKGNRSGATRYGYALLIVSLRCAGGAWASTAIRGTLLKCLPFQVLQSD